MIQISSQKAYHIFQSEHITLPNFSLMALLIEIRQWVKIIFFNLKFHKL